ncbi:MAG: hypothetical protein AAF125_11490 [Chloroflexota bacterium]
MLQTDKVALRLFLLSVYFILGAMLFATVLALGLGVLGLVLLGLAMILPEVLVQLVISILCGLFGVLWLAAAGRFGIKSVTIALNEVNAFDTEIGSYQPKPKRDG